MSISFQAALGAVLMVVGGVKTWLHMGTVPMLALPMCNGKTVNLALTQSSWFEQAHCWGCYAFTLGLGLAAYALYQIAKERRSVAKVMD
mgnify:CR=1 FL=1